MSGGFAQLLRGCRVNAGMTQEQLAELSGISVRAISDMERGRARRPQRRSVEVLGRAMRLPETMVRQLIAASRTDVANPVLTAPIGGISTLPPLLVPIVGREREIDDVLRLMDESGQVSRTVAISGIAGVGKTSLAVAIGHRLESRLPDGQLFVDMRGTEHDALTAKTALVRVLRWMGVDDSAVPAGLDEQAGLYRLLMRQRRILLVLDNVADEAVARPLLTDSPQSVLLITSRRQLPALPVSQRIQLDVLTSEAAAEAINMQLLGKRQADPEPVRQIAELCGHLPLALSIVAGQMAVRATWDARFMVHRLTDEGRRLSLLRAGDLQVRSAFEVSYQLLSLSQARVFRLLGLVYAADFSAAHVAALADIAIEEAEDVLDELVEVGLIQESGATRYQLHDLMRLFVREKFAQEGEPAEEAQRRLVRWLLASMALAGSFYEVDDEVRASLQDFAQTVRAAKVTSIEEAGEWLGIEYPHWIDAVRRAAQYGLHEELLHAVDAMHWYSDIYIHMYPWTEVFQAGLTSARAIQDAKLQAVMLNYLGWALERCEGRAQEALEAHHEAMAIARRVSHHREQAWTELYLGIAHVKAGRGEEKKARQRLNRARELLDKYGTPVDQAITNFTMGYCAFLAGEPSKEIERLRQSHDYLLSRVHLDSERKTIWISMASTAAIWLARSLAAGGAQYEALRIVQQTMAQARQAKADIAVATLAEAEGIIRSELGDLSGARRLFQEAAEIFQRANGVMPLLRVLLLLADAAVAQDDPAAADYLRQGLILCERVDAPSTRQIKEQISSRLAAEDLR